MTCVAPAARYPNQQELMPVSFRSPRFPDVRLHAVLALCLLAVPACAQESSGGEAAPQRPTTTVAAPLTATANPDSAVARALRSRTKGIETAPVTIVEVSDFQCPFCRQFTEQSYAALDSAYIRTGKAKLVFMHYPLPTHRNAWQASEAALCAGAQDAFWPMHDLLFARQTEWGETLNPMGKFAEYAAQLKLDVPALRTCMQEDWMATLIVNDVMQAAGAGINGTPFFILNNKEGLSGAQPFAEFQTRIEGLLAGSPPAPPQR